MSHKIRSTTPLPYKRKPAHVSLLFPHSHPPNPHFATQKMKESTTSVANTDQPQVVSEMSKSFLQVTQLVLFYIIAEVMNIAEDSQQKRCEHAGHKAWRIRGGGVAKVCSLLNTRPIRHPVDFGIQQDCFLGAVGCFLCFGEVIVSTY
jgi:hypothetical protein